MAEKPYGMWFKGNKANQKWSEDDIIDMFEALLSEVETNDDMIYIGEASIWLTKNYGVCSDTRQDWIRKTHTNNKRITRLWKTITEILEIKVVRDLEKLRPAVQGMVLQNRHDFKERQEVDAKVNVMPKVSIDGKPLNLDIGD